MHLSAQQCMNPDFSSPILLDGQRMLPDTIRYTLPKSSSFPATVKLRTTKLLKPYNLEEEQTVPIVDQKYKWALFDNKNSVVEATVNHKKMPGETKRIEMGIAYMTYNIRMFLLIQWILKSLFQYLLKKITIIKRSIL